MSESTARHALPLIAPGQAQKEMSHNEALAVLDVLVQTAVAGVGVDAPPDDPEAGECWVVGDAPTGSWAGHAGALASWTAGGWRFVAPFEGMTAWHAADGVLRYGNGAWTAGDLRGATLTLAGVKVVGAQQPAIATPGGGTTVDAEARAALAAVLAALRTHGLIAS